jgi:hypothetical protein
MKQWIGVWDSFSGSSFFNLVFSARFTSVGPESFWKKPLGNFIGSLFIGSDLCAVS